MEEEGGDPITLILEGCRLARDLESHLGGDPVFLSQACDRISRTFGTAYQRLVYYMNEQLAGHFGYGDRLVTPEGVHGGGELAAGDVGGSSSSPSQRGTGTRRREKEVEKRTVTVPAPLIGNTEMPPDDGFTWRKYGQKEILGSKFPRSYYRCTHQKQFNCPAKKQVQRLDDDPSMFHVTYRGDHTCHMSPTAPVILLPPPPSPSAAAAAAAASTSTPTATATADLPWFTSTTGMYMRDIGSSSDTGPSTVRPNQEEQDPMVDMADVFFNSSSANTMDFMFPPPQDHKD